MLRVWLSDDMLFKFDGDDRDVLDILTKFPRWCREHDADPDCTAQHLCKDLTREIMERGDEEQRAVAMAGVFWRLFHLNYRGETVASAVTTWNIDLDIRDGVRCDA